MDHRLDAEQVHYEWNNALPPRLAIEPGDTVVFDTRDAADRYYRPDSTRADVLARGPFRGHPLTGPVAVKGARPGWTSKPSFFASVANVAYRPLAVWKLLCASSNIIRGELLVYPGCSTIVLNSRSGKCWADAVNENTVSATQTSKLCRGFIDSLVCRLGR